MRAFRRIIRYFRPYTYKVLSGLLIAAMLIASASSITPAKTTAAEDKETLPPVVADDTEPEEKAELPKATGIARTDQDVDIESVSKKVKLHIPEGAVTEDTDIEVTEHGQWGPRDGGMLNVLEFNAFSAKDAGKDIRKEIKTFNKGLNLSIQHDPGELRGLDQDSLGLYYLDEETRQWVLVPDSSYNKDTGIMTATLNHFSYYGEMANPVISGPGQVMNFQTDLNSGSAVSSYPIEVPPGVAGFQPSLQLTYSSASVDEMKNKRDVGSWVGIGWSLSLGSISYDDTTGRYFLNMSGISTQLVQAPDGTWHTRPETYYKVTKTNNIWDVYDRGGNHYQFGGTYDSLQYYFDYPDVVYYRFDLNKMEDTSGNLITVTYLRDINGGDVRSAYPWHVQYNNNRVDIIFTSTFDTTTPYNRRLDNPQGTANNPAPRVIENRKLDSIEVKLDGSLVRKYAFSYTTTNDYSSGDYSGIYYAGRHYLNSITQIGADGTSALPAMSFGYEFRNPYHNDPNQAQYYGNPGNPVFDISWPYLTSANNGYGGSTNYTYAQSPAGSPVNIWTRQVVTTKTVNPGIGTQQTYQYSYTGNPKYLKLGPWEHAWEDEFRGFSQVRETDAAGNYTEHYYWTTDATGSEIMTGKEYKTEWYNFTGQLLERKEFNWTYRYDNVGSPATLESGAVGYWNLNNNALDSSGQGNNGTLINGPTWTGSGWFNSALHLDGADDYVDPGDGSSLNLTGDFTISAWIKRDSLNTFDNILVIGDSFWGAQISFELYPGYPEGIRLYISNDSFGYINSGFYHYNLSSAGIRDLYWHHLAVTFQGITSTIYLDGFALPSHIEAAGNRETGGSDRRIGSDIYGDNFHGTIDDVRVCNRALGAGEIAAQARLASPFVYLSSVTDTVFDTNNPPGSPKTSSTSYVYDSYGNVTYEYANGDDSITTDNITIRHEFSPNTTLNILSKPAVESVYDYAGQLKSQKCFYYDSHNSSPYTPPDKGLLTRVEQNVGNGSSVSSYYTYDIYGNRLTEQDGKGYIWTTAYESTYHIFPYTITSPNSQVETYNFDVKTGNLLSRTNVNNQTTYYEYDTFGRNTTVIEPGDDSVNPTVKYEYNNWGTLGQQHLKTLNRLSGTDYLWKSEYFDGLGRVIQTQSRGDAGRTIIPGTTIYNNRGLVAYEYVSQDLPTSEVNGYKTPLPEWKYAYSAYDAMGRVTVTMAADATTNVTDYSLPWQETVTNPLGYKHRYYYDAFGRLKTVEELNASQAIYATTTYSYDTLGNLTQVRDNNNNTTNMGYDWLSRKTSMTDPDMGSWSYTYDYNSNLQTQTDAKWQTITFAYDNLNRLTGKTYPAGSGMTNVGYTYDSYDGVTQFGKGLRTGMTDASGSTSYKYDSRGRLIEEKRNISGIDYTTGYTYDSSDRVVTITYPTGEVVTQTFDGRSLPESLSGSSAGSLVSSTDYNQLGQIKQINLGSGAYTTFNYYGLDTGAPSGYYGRLWQIKTTKSPNPPLQDMQYTWDANGNLTQRYNTVAGETETFGYDFLDRLTSVSGAYSNSYAYNQIGNITSMNGASYTYGSKPHAVTAVGSTSYVYDANGNMTTRGSQSLTWDVENRLVNAASTAEILNKTFGGTGYDYANAGQQTADGGYIFAGYTNSSGAGGYDAWLVKTDSSLAQQWSRTFGTSGNEYAYDGQQTSDGGYVLAGSNSSGAWLIKTDSSGNQQWSQTFSGAGSHARAVQQTSDGGYILAGSNGSQVRLIKTDSSGVQQWSQTYGGGIAYAVQQTTDGGYILAGTNLSQGLLIKTNSSGTQQWSQTYGGSGADYFYDVRQTSDGSYIIAGSYSIPEYDEYGELWDAYYVWLVKTNSSGTQQWSQILDAGDAFAVQQTTDGGYIVAGTAGCQGWLRKTDSSGAQQWTRNHGGSSYDRFNAVQQTSDSGYILAGYTLSYGAGNSDAWLVKTDSQGYVVSQGPTSSFIYDGDGNRVQDTENGQATLYINRYYEKNLTTSEVTTHYYLGDREVAFRKGTTLEYVHQDHLGSTSVTTNSSGTVVDSVRYYPFGGTRSSTAPLDTDKLFTGQRLDQTGLYFYNARYYDATIGRFISPDSIVPDPRNPQAFNRYSYVLNNPLKYTDPSGHFWDWVVDIGSVAFDVVELVRDPSWGNAGLLGADVALWVVPFVPSGAGYIAKGAKAANKIEDASHVVRAVNKSDDALGSCHALNNVATGQLHHAISKKVSRALEKSETLKGKYKYRDSRFTTRARDRASHNGYDTFHRQLDDQVVNWISSKKSATPDEFESFLKNIYSEPDLIQRFPNGLK